MCGVDVDIYCMHALHTVLMIGKGKKTFFLLCTDGNLRSHRTMCARAESDYLINEFMNVTGEKW